MLVSGPNLTPRRYALSDLEWSVVASCADHARTAAPMSMINACGVSTLAALPESHLAALMVVGKKISVYQNLIERVF